jgi:type IV secretion system protein TrbL
MNPPTDATVLGLLVPLIDLNPFHWAGDKVKESLADAFTSMMMALWSAGLWLIDMVFGVIDRFTTPNVADPGLGHLYGITLWLSLLIALIIGIGQVGLAAIRRDGRTLGSLTIGIIQYGAVVTGWVAVCAALVLGCAGLTRALLHELLNIDGFAGYSASAGMTDQVSGTVQAAVLGVCALFLLVPAAFGYLLITLVREAALLILTATMPIAAAGALGEGTKAWLWRSVRWFAAACLTAPLLALVVGVGVQISRAAFPDGPTSHGRRSTTAEAGLAEAVQRQVTDTSANVGMAVVGCVILLIGCFCPMVLFRLLAFVDPGTASGASFRSTMTANGGLAGLLSGGRATQGQGSGAATEVTADGRAASESSADAETANRFQSKFVTSFGVAGRAAGGAMGAGGTVAAHGASMTLDVLGQSGVGHQGYYDTTPPAATGKRGPVRTRVGHGWGPDEPPEAGAANEPARIGGGSGPTGHAGLGPEVADSPAVAEVAEDGAFLA